MKILLLGGGGFIGSHLTDQLLTQSEHQICAYDLYSEKLADSIGHPRLQFVRGDIRYDHQRLDQMVREADVVVDLIAYCNPSMYVKMPLDVVRLNFDQNLVIVEQCVKHRTRLIQLSTCEVYGKTVVPLVREDLHEADHPRHAVFQEDESHLIVGPVNKQRWIYSCAKQLLERILHAYGLEDRLDYTIIRPFNFIGPRIDYLPSEQDGNPRVFTHFIDCLKTGAAMQLVNGGEQKRCYMLISDAVEAIAKAIENRGGVCRRQIFNIGNPNNEVSIRQLAEKMRDVYRRRWWNGKSPLPELISVPGEEFYGAGYDDSDRRIPDIRKAMELLDWRPRFGIDKVIERSMAHWFEARQDAAKPLPPGAVVADDLAADGGTVDSTVR